MIDSLDSQLLLFINGMHTDVLDTFMYAYSSKLVWIPFYAALAYLLARNLSWKTTLLCLLAVGLTIGFADQVCSHLIRPFVERYRPSRLENPLSEFVHIVNGYRGGLYGFPSCHAANTFGLAFFFFLLCRRSLLTMVMMMWALATCYSRAYLGVHYPGDLLVGALVGIVGAWLMYRLFVFVNDKCFAGRNERMDKLLVWKGVLVPVAVCLLTVAGIIVYAGYTLPV